MEYNIAFSSSGARFAAHIGVLAYLQDHNIKIKNYSGTSGGAIVASWGANGFPARELMDLTLKFGYAEFFLKPSLKFGGLFDHTRFLQVICSYCKPQKNLWIATFNVLKMQKEIWSGVSYNLFKILSATTSVPGLFKPVLYSNGLHIDGIFASFCPDDLWTGEMTLSVQLKSKMKTKARYLFDNFMHEVEKATIDFLDSNQKRSSKHNDLIYIYPDTSSIAQTDLFLLESKDHIELFNKGYEAAEAALTSKVLAHSQKN